MVRVLLARVAPFALLFTLASGCAQVTRKPLLDENRKAIASSETIANMSQEEIATSIQRSTGGAAIGGLFGALIDAAVDSKRASKAESGAAPLRDLLVGYDPRPTVKAAMTKELAKVAAFRNTKLEVGREPRLDRATVSGMLDAAGTDALMLVDFDYRLSPDFKFIVVTSVASVFPTKAAADEKLKAMAAAPNPDNAIMPCPALYHEIFMSSMPAPGEGTGIARWTADGGAAARMAIEGGIAEVARLLAWDLEQDGPKGTDYAVAGASQVVAPQFGPRQWYSIDAQDGRTWLRATTGELASMGDSYAGVAVGPTPTEPKGGAEGQKTSSNP